MKYYEKNGLHIAEVPAQDFQVILVDEKKMSIGNNRCNGGFFGSFSESGEAFTLPVGHLVCDYAAKSKWTEFYCKQRGKFQGGKFHFDSGAWSHQNPFYGKAQSTLVIKDGAASIQDLRHAPDGCSYAIAGVPIMRNGADVKFATYVRGQGWDGSTLYGTWHIFVGIKSSATPTVYVMAMKTSTGNMILSAEAYRKFKVMGFWDVIKLDGGGSFYFNAGGRKKYTAENRRVCTILNLG